MIKILNSLHALLFKNCDEKFEKMRAEVLMLEKKYEESCALNEYLAGEIQEEKALYHYQTMQLEEEIKKLKEG
jgi:hypothetical protein